MVSTAPSDRPAFDLFVPNAFDMDAIVVESLDHHIVTTRLEPNRIADFEAHLQLPVQLGRGS
jgi:hypothetical protein